MVPAGAHVIPLLLQGPYQRIMWWASIINEEEPRPACRLPRRDPRQIQRSRAAMPTTLAEAGSATSCSRRQLLELTRSVASRPPPVRRSEGFSVSRFVSERAQVLQSVGETDDGRRRQARVLQLPGTEPRKGASP